MSALPLFIGGIGLPELLVFGLVVLVLFGSRLPKVMRSLGSSITEFKKGVNEGSQDDEDDAVDTRLETKSK
ncbi:MAG: twin-arginine translocase TatA/TatE family subunit [Planctomycetota bacterium]|nr:twin-arginine translocase TatA/TatE family subunit [Planctomycetaceae bacterium]MDQ3332493.1 twin-arginine translocase TatA/TatE family subunit [Planctomycetota bacterium]